MQGIDFRRAILVPKLTRVEYDGERLGLDASALRRRYPPEDARIIFASHRRQLAMRKRMRRLFPEARVVMRRDLTPSVAAQAGLVIALGGDGHFVALAQAIEGTPILGVNADPLRSHGGLLSLSERGIHAAVRRLRQGRFRIREWTRIDVFVEGRFVGRATSEVFLGESSRLLLSRHVLNGQEHRSSGLLVATGAGSTGWFGHYARSFPPTAKSARWVLTEPFPPDAKYPHASGILRPGEALVVRSRNDIRGVVSLDAIRHVPFPYGAVATLRLSSIPLRVVEIK